MKSELEVREVGVGVGVWGRKNSGVDTDGTVGAGAGDSGTWTDDVTRGNDADRGGDADLLLLELEGLLKRDWSSSSIGGTVGGAKESAAVDDDGMEGVGLEPMVSGAGLAGRGSSVRGASSTGSSRLAPRCGSDVDTSTTGVRPNSSVRGAGCISSSGKSSPSSGSQYVSGGDSRCRFGFGRSPRA